MGGGIGGSMVSLRDKAVGVKPLWFQKSREKWVRQRDRNTSFFHAQIVMEGSETEWMSCFWMILGTPHPVLLFGMVGSLRALFQIKD